MKKSFPGYYPQNDDARKDIWENATFVFDTCSLLNLYSYSDTTREEVLSVLDKVTDRVWIPHQVGLEYHRNRTNRVSQECKNFDSQIRAFEEFIEAVEKAHRSKRQHPFISEEKLESLKDAIDAINADLKGGFESLESQLTVDPILDRLTTLFEDKVGEPFTSKELEEIYKEGRERYKHDIPPGYADDKDKGGDKGDPEMFGDLILWKEILRFAKAESTPIIFVTDDEKEDWWRKARGRRIGARPELLVEFTTETEQPCLLYGSESFLFEASTFIGELSPDVVEEVQSVAKARRDSGVALRKHLASINRQASLAETTRLNELVKDPFSDSIQRMIKNEAALRALPQPALEIRRAIEAFQRATRNPLDGINFNTLWPLRDYPSITDAMPKIHPSDDGNDTDQVPEDDTDASINPPDDEAPRPSSDEED